MTPNLLITVEHASNRLPASVNGLGLAKEVLGTHVAWDPGARELGRATHKALGGELLEGEWSRLFVDLNRSETNRKVVPLRSFGVAIPGNTGLSRNETLDRVEAWWRPFRRRAQQIAAGSRRCLHVSMHTFTPELAGERRDFDLAVLYDPRRPWERSLADTVIASWKQAGWTARRNAPYRGVADGHTTALRRLLPDARYAGLEIEANQRNLGRWREVGAAVAEGIKRALGK